MIETFVWRESLLRVPFEAPRDKVDKLLFGLAAQLVHHVPEALFFLLEGETLAIGRRHGRILLLKLVKEVLPRGPR